MKIKNKSLYLSFSSISQGISIRYYKVFNNPSQMKGEKDACQHKSIKLIHKCKISTMTPNIDTTKKKKKK